MNRRPQLEAIEEVGKPSSVDWSLRVERVIARLPTPIAFGLMERQTANSNELPSASCEKGGIPW